MKYAVVEKECLAVKWAIETLKYYLLGREFTLVTDHAPLRFMKENKEKNARVTRWFLALQPYKFRIEHRKGTQNANADGLSRKHVVGWSAQTDRLELGGRICEERVAAPLRNGGAVRKTTQPRTPSAN